MSLKVRAFLYNNKKTLIFWSYSNNFIFRNTKLCSTRMDKIPLLHCGWSHCMVHGNPLTWSRMRWHSFQNRHSNHYGALWLVRQHLSFLKSQELDTEVLKDRPTWKVYFRRSFVPSMDVEYEGRLGRGKVKEKNIIDLIILHAYIVKKWITRDGDSFKNIK